MAVCDRYTNNQDDAVEILNDGFLKVFKEIYRYKPAYTDVVSSFKGWLRKIMVYTAIDHFRKNHKHQFTTDLDNGVVQVASHAEDALDGFLFRARANLQHLVVVERFVVRHSATSRTALAVRKENLESARAGVPAQRTANAITFEPATTPMYWVPSNM